MACASFHRCTAHVTVVCIGTTERAGLRLQIRIRQGR
jgi:hypothetical protein